MTPGRFGVLTTDAELIVQSWDDWLAAAMSLPADDAKGRALGHLVPSLQQRGLVDRFKETLSSGIVQVFSPTLHGAVFPCAPTVPSAHFQLMQQRVTAGPLLDGERIAGLIITVQDVTPELDAERSLADALTSGDEEQRRAAVEAIANSKKIESLDSFSPALRSDDWRVRRATVDSLAAAADQDLLRALLATLQREHRNFSTLSSALRLLAITDVEIIAPLAELLNNEDVDLRIQAALALGEQHHPAAIPPLLAALDDPDANVRFHAIEALGHLRADAAVDPLIAIVESGDFFLGFAALEALAAIGDSRVAPRLAPLLALEAFREPAARALSTLGNERVVVPLVETLNRFPGATHAVVAALARIADRLADERIDIAAVARESLSAEGRQRLFSAVETAPLDARPALARVIGWAGGEEALTLLGELANESDVRDEALEALVRHGERSVPVLVDALDTDDHELRAAVIAALGRVGSRQATAPLIRMLEDPETAIGAGGALARIGDAAAFEPLLALASHEDTAVRLAAIGALNSIGHLDMPARVAILLDDPDPLTRESAVRIAGYFGYADAADAVLARAADPEERVRIAALEHLPFFDDARVLPALSRAFETEPSNGRAAIARALARVGHSDSVPLLVRALQDPDQWVRYFAARSLGQLTDAAPLPELLAVAEHDPSQPVRVAALEAIGARRASAAVEPLLRCAADVNMDVAAAALFALGRLGGAEAAAMLQRAARDGDAVRRKAAAHGLAELRDNDAISLLEWLAAADADPYVVETAIRGLADVANSETAAASLAVDSLVALLADPNRCEGATVAIARIPVSQIPRVARGLNHVNPNVRRRTVDALARYRRPEATRLLEAALQDEDPRIRETAAVAIARLGSRMFDTRLGDLARRDPSKSVRRAAAEALASVRSAT